MFERQRPTALQRCSSCITHILILAATLILTRLLTLLYDSLKVHLQLVNPSFQDAESILQLSLPLRDSALYGPIKSCYSRSLIGS